MQGLLNRSLGVEGEAGVDLSRDLAGDDLQDFPAELNQESVNSSIDLAVDITTLSLSIFYSSVDQFGVFGLLRRGEEERRISGSILRLVLSDG